MYGSSLSGYDFKNFGGIKTVNIKEVINDNYLTDTSDYLRDEKNANDFILTEINFAKRRLQEELAAINTIKADRDNLTLLNEKISKATVSPTPQEFTTITKW